MHLQVIHSAVGTFIATQHYIRLMAFFPGQPG